MPLISVLMPFYNSELTIGDAVSSILAQTVADFELILVDDGSTDGSLAVAEDHASRDPRVVLIGDDRNRGVVERLNQGLALCRGEFIARMDADDRAYRHRFAKQTEYLGRHDRVIAVSSAAMVTDGGGDRKFVYLPDGDARGDVYQVPALEPYLPHSFLMVRAAAMRKVGGYRHVFHAEDADLCWRLREIGETRNMPELLGEYCVHDQSVSSKSNVNGRLQAVFSQLSALSARRRLEGRADIRFSLEQCHEAETHAANFAGLIDFAARANGLSDGERNYLTVAAIVKYLQHAEWRPYKLEPADVPFACRALSLGLKLDIDPLSGRNIRVIYRRIFQRMMRGSRYRDASRLVLQNPRCALLKPPRLRQVRASPRAAGQA